MRRILKTLTVALGVAAVSGALAPAPAKAQDVANGSATATVQAVLTVVATGALAFGNVFQGVSTSIANNNASAGIFTVTGQASSGISIYMQLPDYLATATGDDRMVVAFSSTDASVDTTGNSDPTAFGSGWANTNPHSFPSATVVGSGGQTDIFLGGKVNPSVDQAAGAYTADIILTVAYNGT